MRSVRLSRLTGVASWVEAPPRLRCACSSFSTTPALRQAHQHAKATGGDTDSAREINEAIRTALRRHGPLPLTQLSKRLDDAVMEAVSEEQGGLGSYVASRSGTRRGTSAEALASEDRRSLPFELVTLPGAVKVVFLTEYFGTVQAAHRPLVMWLAAVFVATEHFPGCRLLRSRNPTRKELFHTVMDHAPAALLRSPSTPRTLPAFEAWLPCAEPVLSVFGGRVALQGRATRQELQSQQETASCLRQPRRGRAVANLPRQERAAVGNEEQKRDARLREFLRSHVPTTFFIPMSVVIEGGLVKAFPEANGDMTAIRALFAHVLESGFAHIHAFGEEGAAPSLDTTFIRLLDPQPLDTLRTDGVRFPEDTLTARYSVFALGEKIVADLARLRSGDAAAKAAQAKGTHVSQLKLLLKPATYDSLLRFFAQDTTGSTAAEGTTGGGEGKAPVSPDAFILVLDRLRHIFDVRLGDGVFRPWSVLPPAEQPSSLTRETTPLPLLLRFAESVLRAESLTVEELFERLPEVLQRQLLAAYSDARWADVGKSREELENEMTRRKGAQCLRGFVAQHSLYFVLRKDADGVDRVCSPQLLAAAFDGGAGGPRGGRKDTGPNGCWARAEDVSDTERAEMLYALLPVDQPVAWTHFSNLPAVRALPFPAFSMRQEFFRRHFSFFRLYETFANTSLIVGRADGVPPPPSVLQPSLQNLDDVVKFLALQSIGGVSDGAVMQSLSKQGRTFMKAFGNFTSLAEQLPQWFECRRDNFNAGNSLITFTGPGQPTEEDKQAFVRARLPLRRVRNDASCYLPSEAPHARETYDEWNPEWDEE